MPYLRGMEQPSPYSLESLPERARQNLAETQAFFKMLRRKKPKRLDDIAHELHAQAFERIDCLQCANCCRTLGPRVSETDIKRLSKHLKTRPAKLIEQYLRKDEDGDWVFRSMPCPFLLDDNRCSVYEARPKACREYPHTDQKRLLGILAPTLLNRATCPAVFDIVEELKKRQW